MKKFIVSILVVMLISNNALAEDVLHSLWDIPLNPYDFVDNVKEKKLINMELDSVTHSEDGLNHVEYKSPKDDLFSLCGYSAQLTYSHDWYDDDKTPVNIKAEIKFPEWYDPEDFYLTHGSVKTNAILDGLIEKYGDPSSIRVKFSNYSNYYDDKYDRVEDVYEPDPSWYKNNYINIVTLVSWWDYEQYGLDKWNTNVYITFDIYFNNVCFDTQIDYYSEEVGSVENTVTFYPDPVVPMEIGNTFTKKDPSYEDTGF